MRLRRLWNNLRYRWLITRHFDPNGNKRLSIIHTNWRGKEIEAIHFIVADETDRAGNRKEFIPYACRR